MVQGQVRCGERGRGARPRLGSGCPVVPAVAAGAQARGGLSGTDDAPGFPRLAVVGPDPRAEPLMKPFDLHDELPEGTTLLEASAGTGKTFAVGALVTRYVA